MNDSVAAKSFVRSALRLPTSIEGNAVRTARRKFNSIAKVLGEGQEVFSRFEVASHGEMLCTFGTEQGLLLAETIRDWVANDLIGEDTFLWCERMGDEYALVCIMDGRIIKESFERPNVAIVEVPRLINRLRANNAEFYVFLHRAHPSELNLDENLKIRHLKRSVLEHVDLMEKPAPKLLPYSQAVQRVASKWRIRGIVLGGLLAILLAAPATWLGVNWWLGEPAKIDFTTAKQYKKLVQEYRDLLLSPDPGQLLTAIHRSSLEFLTDPWFGEHWSVEAFEWDRESGRLKVRASLPKVSLPDSQGEALGQELQQQILAQAEKRGWKVSLSGFTATFALPVIAEGRSQKEADRISLLKPGTENGSWDINQMSREMKLVGELSPQPQTSENTEVYRTETAVLNIHSDPWPTGDTAQWIGRRLKGGPLVLDSVTLKALPGSRGGFVNGEIVFRVIWRSDRRT